MSNQVECPYCGCGRNTIDEPMGDDETTEIDCRECGKTFQVHSSISVNYEPRCAEGDCDLKGVEGHPDLLCCSRCDNFTSKARHEREAGLKSLATEMSYLTK